jgi:hypothetical protein
MQLGLKISNNWNCSVKRVNFEKAINDRCPLSDYIDYDYAQ